MAEDQDDVFTKLHILAEIKRTAQMNGGAPLGTARFRTETGIKTSDWMGKFWARWGDALAEAGFRPNALQTARDAEELLERLAELARELGHFPVATEMKLKARREVGFPWHNTFARFGGKQALAARLREFCLARGDEEVVALCDVVLQQMAKCQSGEETSGSAGDDSEIGYVYLLKCGRYFKLGRSNAVGRRERELAVQLPEKANVVHSIKTDDPVGIEGYWHGRFSKSRKNGEWFDLSRKDVAAFQRRKFM